jgi:hypothetical protein
MRHINERHHKRFINGETSIAPADYFLSTFPSYTLDYDVAYMGVGNGGNLTSLVDRSNKHGPGCTLFPGPSGAPNISVLQSELNGAAFMLYNNNAFMSSSATSPLVLSQSITIFVVAKRTETTNLNSFLFDGFSTSIGAGQRCYLFRPSGGATLEAGCNTTNMSGTYSWATYDNVWRLFEVHLVGSGSGTILNGSTQVNSANIPTTGNINCSGLILGCRVDGNPGTFRWEGGIARFTAFNGNLTGSDLIKVRNYFRTKYALY